MNVVCISTKCIKAIKVIKLLGVIIITFISIALFIIDILKTNEVLDMPLLDLYHIGIRSHAIQARFRETICVFDNYGFYQNF